uniref:Uncharacterized protein n=1 Tax=Cacopsylla melanoneura TaxID=428564 RepID=A0A8D9FDT1_9HEMI
MFCNPLPVINFHLKHPVLHGGLFRITILYLCPHQVFTLTIISSSASFHSVTMRRYLFLVLLPEPFDKCIFLYKGSITSTTCGNCGFDMRSLFQTISSSLVFAS